ncbi:PQQ-binding-like beta-propeller repeat protein [Catenovulum sp. SM1970]|uniref:WD40 repeat domain-containing protein n=1 Tax=Marinifaba aquimaris TaxID=2741323 RepID=UPI001574BD3A|nr:PQQ-binding-like beta-propeller repeat protein [Marinifaba aquimaris]NTS75708.1 PQQ-binding-like beta-propeller repeat protein [Marinifaba aquimaris]
MAPYQAVIAILSMIFLVACQQAAPEKINEYVHTDNGAYTADLSTNGQYAVISSAQGIMTWQLDKNLPKYIWHHKANELNQVIYVHIAHDNSVVATAESQKVALWNLQTGRNKGFWSVAESPIEQVKVSNQGKILAVALQNGVIEIYNLDSGRRLRFLGHQERISQIDISANGQYLLSGDYAGKAILWDTKTAQVVYDFSHQGRITQVKLDNQGRYAFTANNFKQSYIWDLQSGEKLSQLQYPMRQLIFSSVEFSNNGKYLATGAPNKKIKYWHVQTGELLSQWSFKADGFAASVLDFAFSENDRTLLAENSFGLAEEWDISELNIH